MKLGAQQFGKRVFVDSDSQLPPVATGVDLGSWMVWLYPLRQPALVAIALGLAIAASAGFFPGGNS